MSEPGLHETVIPPTGTYIGRFSDEWDGETHHGFTLTFDQGGPMYESRVPSYEPEVIRQLVLDYGFGHGYTDQLMAYLRHEGLVA